jgi:hypothetical protein
VRQEVLPEGLRYLLLEAPERAVIFKRLAAAVEQVMDPVAQAQDAS